MLTREQEHLPFFNPYITELCTINDAEKHAALVLVEPFLWKAKLASFEPHDHLWTRVTSLDTYLSLVDMVVISLIWSADDHHDEVLAIVGTEIVHRRFQQVRILFNPLRKVKRWSQRHSGLEQLSLVETMGLVVRTELTRTTLACSLSRPRREIDKINIRSYLDLRSPNLDRPTVCCIDVFFKFVHNGPLKTWLFSPHHSTCLKRLIGIFRELEPFVSSAVSDHKSRDSSLRPLNVSRPLPKP